MREKIEEYLALRKAEGLAATSLEHYRHRLLALAGFLEQKRGIRRWQDAKPSDIDAYVRSMASGGRAFSSREGHVACLRHFLRTLAGRGAILADPSRHVRLPKPRAEDLPLLEPPLSEEQVARLIESLPRRNAVDLRNVLHVELLYSAGLRLGESLALEVRDANLQGGILHVRKGKGGHARDIPMMRGLQFALRDYLALRRSLLRGPDQGALLLLASGKRATKGSTQQFLNRLNAARARQRQRPVHAHLFRHSIAVHLLRGGADIRYVQEFLGHESLETTKGYLRLVPADLRKAYDDAMPEVGLGTATA